jgi:YD repeat-containing protein
VAALAGTGWLQYQFGDNRAYTVTQYRLTSGADTGDYPGRAPKDWQLLGSNDGTTWAVFDTEAGQADTASSDARTYAVASPGSYAYYRLNVTANNGDADTQLADLQLVAPPPVPVNVPASSVTFGYDAAGNQTSTTDELGHTSSTTYDPMDRVLTTQASVRRSPRAGNEVISASTC